MKSEETASQRQYKRERTRSRARWLPLLLTFLVGGMGCMVVQVLQAILTGPAVPLTDAGVMAIVFGVGAAGGGLWGGATWSATKNAWLGNVVAGLVGVLLGVSMILWDR